MLFPKTLGPLLAMLAVSGLAGAQSPIGEIYASDASVKGSVQLTAGGMRVMSGSSVAAGDSAAVLRLARGGEVRVCPRTSLSISSSQNDRDLMLGMSSGALETHYNLPASADAVITPDFRLLLAGPGVFHFAIGADAHGNTCVQSLANDSASIIVSELMGNGIYQVKPNQAVTFHGGTVADPQPLVGSCGCPPPAPTMRAEEAPLNPAPVPQPAAPPAPAPQPSDVHIQVDAPFVFRADQPEPSPVEPAVRLRLAVAPQLPLAALPPKVAVASPVPQPTPVAQLPKPQAKKKFFGRIRSFFATIFH